MKWNGKIKRHNPNLVTLRPLWPKNALETTTPMEKHGPMRQEKDTLKYGFNLLCCGKKSDHSAASGCAKRNRLLISQKRVSVLLPEMVVFGKLQ